MSLSLLAPLAPAPGLHWLTATGRLSQGEGESTDMGDPRVLMCVKHEYLDM